LIGGRVRILIAEEYRREEVQRSQKRKKILSVLRVFAAVKSVCFIAQIVFSTRLA
jgi:hypothetical protein